MAEYMLYVLWPVEQRGNPEVEVGNNSPDMSIYQARWTSFTSVMPFSILGSQGCKPMLQVRRYFPVQKLAQNEETQLWGPWATRAISKWALKLGLL